MRTRNSTSIAPPKTLAKTDSNKQEKTSDRRNFRCTQCTDIVKTYLSQQSLWNHISKKHKPELKKYACNMCAYSSKHYLVLVNHIIKKRKKDHSFKVYESEDVNETSKFFQSIVNDGRYSFIKTTSPKQTNEGTTSYYICNSCRYGTNCSCFIKNTKDGNKTTITYYNIHSHEPMLNKIRLAKNEKECYMTELQHGLTVDKIHNKIVKNFNIQNLTKNQLVTKNYLRYLRNELNTFESYHKDDFKNCYEILEHYKEKCYIQQFIYKNKGVTISGYTELTNNFILALQTKSQNLTFIKEQSSYILADSTHSTNIYNYNLITFAVLTRRQRFLPVLWIITDSVSEKVVSYVLKEFSSQSNVPLTPDIITSDMSPVYKNSWAKSIESRIRWIFCIWHVKKAIIKNINLKVRNIEIREAIEKKFKDLCKTTTKVEFKKKLALFTTFIINHSKTFSDYFIQYYTKDVETWACYARCNLELNTNMFTESFHNVLKNQHIKRHSNHRLDFLLYSLFNYDSTRAMHEQLSLLYTNKEYMGYREKMAYEKHKLIDKLDSRKFKKKGPIVCYKKYRIKRSSCEGCLNKCPLLCRQCGICKGRYTCTCLCFLIKKQMCKHIHKAHELFYKNISKTTPITEHELETETNKILEESKKYCIVQNRESIEKNESNYLLTPDVVFINGYESLDGERLAENTSNLTSSPSNSYPYREEYTISVQNTKDHNLDAKMATQKNKTDNQSMEGSSSKQNYLIDSKITKDEFTRLKTKKIKKIKHHCKNLIEKLENAASVEYLENVESKIKFIDSIQPFKDQIASITDARDKTMMIKPLQQRKRVRKRNKTKDNLKYMSNTK